MRSGNCIIYSFKIEITTFMAATPYLSVSSRASRTIIYVLRLLSGGVASELLSSGNMDGALLPQIDSGVVHCVLV